ncbi:SNF2-related protein [Rhodopirellula bahusiensis]|uniref:DEAD/DEAH box helicase n=1 Tax=Rhodopirellula bahusiensis TaxID=2014065 RepID=A0A2G1W6X0_9BACT|nr:SNF2-related protein [Rhodopirellula bahusiensis]PHQ34785.1 DEAD/DEAH box helicase [Rhodopirellula bahusiensis]
MTPYHSQYWAHLLTLKGAGGTIENLTRSISNARVDLNPHQIDAALFALRSPLSKGAILADEVGLGKTIEAGIVLSQRWAERKRRILLIVPATLRKQWQQELDEKFYLPSLVLDGAMFNRLRKQGETNPFMQDDKIVICSYHFISAKAPSVQGVPWDLVVIDEAHRLRNVFKPQSKMARRIADSIGPAHKLLLTATPLQNSLMELYGLVSIIDEHVFGDAASFRDQFVRTGSEAERNSQLRNRLNPVCIRTLRKQVVEYVSYTKRIPITQDFTPSDDEHQLYESVSAFLQRENLVSLPASQRHLITLVLRKLLASSTFAIAGTLQGLVGRLRAMQKDLPKQQNQTALVIEAVEENYADDDSLLIDESDFESICELQDEWEPDEETDGVAEQVTSAEPVTTTQPQKTPANTEQDYIDPKLLEEELQELLGFSKLASRITINAKGEALIPALEIALRRAAELGAERKAVIFTESRRTQTYLFDLLSKKGYEGELVLMNGSNADPLSKQVYEDWLKRHAGQECVSGSKAVDIKAAIVEEFKDRASILIATEAAAEGVNLQFCSLVVNFDLPWNPQRIEQRIGRCHRYGQKHDVVVVNFLNRRNQADERVFEILSEKFTLFDGVFGASDQVLGALESGVDIERRIAAVYQTCRNPAQIAAAFDQLQSDLDAQIQVRMDDTRQVLLENFDEEVAARLKVHRDKTLESLGERERWLLNLTRSELNGDATFDPNEPRFKYQGKVAHSGYYHFDWRKANENGDAFYRQGHPLATAIIESAIQRKLDSATLNFNYSAYGSVVSVLEPLLGQSGWLELSKLTINSLDVEEFLLLTGVTDDGTVLDADVCGKLLSIPATVEDSVAGSLPDLSASRDTEMTKRVREVEQRNMKHFDEEVLKLDHWSDDLKQGLEREIKELDKEIREARKVAALAASLAEKLEAQKQIKSLESNRKEKRKRLYEAQDEIDNRRDELIGQIEVQLGQQKSVSNLFTIRWALN